VNATTARGGRCCAKTARNSAIVEIIQARLKGLSAHTRADLIKIDVEMLDEPIFHAIEDQVLRLMPRAILFEGRTAAASGGYVIQRHQRELRPGTWSHSRAGRVPLSPESGAHLVGHAAAKDYPGPTSFSNPCGVDVASTGTAEADVHAAKQVGIASHRHRSVDAVEGVLTDLGPVAAVVR
jgi:hypothetical protein